MICGTYCNSWRYCPPPHPPPPPPPPPPPHTHTHTLFSSLQKRTVLRLFITRKANEGEFRLHKDLIGSAKAFEVLHVSESDHISMELLQPIFLAANRNQIVDFLNTSHSHRGSVHGIKWNAIKSNVIKCPWSGYYSRAAATLDLPNLHKCCVLPSSTKAELRTWSGGNN